MIVATIINLVFLILTISAGSSFIVSLIGLISGVVYFLNRKMMIDD